MIQLHENISRHPASSALASGAAKIAWRRPPARVGEQDPGDLGLAAVLCWTNNILNFII
jgi:hypothetical protein